MGTLSQLREEARLPVIIKTNGLNGALSSNERLSRFMVKADQLHVPEEMKVDVLKQLLEYDSLSDIQVEHASLEFLYQHFLDSARVGSDSDKETI